MSDKPVAAVNVTANQVVTVEMAAPVTGKHDVYILFRGGDEQLFDFDWWQVQ